MKKTTSKPKKIRKATQSQKQNPARRKQNNSAARQSKKRATVFNLQSLRFGKTSSRVTAALRKMRNRGISLTRAAQEIGISPRTLKRHAASGLQKSPSGRYTAKPSDRLTRDLLVPTASGPQEIRVRNSRDASRLGSYWSALHKYFESGDTSGLKKFDGQFVTDVSRKQYPLITDLDVLNQLGSAGAVSFESIYSWSAQ